jgi:hypothetical protein
VLILCSQSTKRLRETTQARVVWHALAYEYSARHFHNVRPESGTIGTLSTDDLRDWISPRLILDEIWKKETIPPPRTRLINISRSTNCWQLLPGGRWLITGCREGNVNFYDLNMEKPVPRPLFQPSPSIKGIEFIAISIDQNAPVLEFTIVISHSGISDWLQNECHGHLGGIHVGKARLVGAGPSASLTARSITSIPSIRPHTHVSSLTVSGELIARKTTTERRHHIEIFQWTKCSSTTLTATSICKQFSFPPVNNSQLDFFPVLISV